MVMAAPAWFAAGRGTSMYACSCVLRFATTTIHAVVTTSSGSVLCWLVVLARLRVFTLFFFTLLFAPQAGEIFQDNFHGEVETVERHETGHSLMNSG